MRFIAASLVIVSHAFPLSTGNTNDEPFVLLSNGQSGLGKLAVSIFFVISGFLITQSFDRKKEVFSYAKSRILRIFPAVIFLIFVTVFIFGPIVSYLPVLEYFKNPLTYDYMKTVFLYPIRYALPGVFEHNIYPYSVNGSLWTLYIEFTFYILVAVLGVLKLLNKCIVLLFTITAVLLTHYQVPFFLEYMKLFPYFGAGMFVYLTRDNVLLNKWLALFSLVFLVLTLQYGHFNVSFILFGTYLIFYLAFSERLNFYDFGKNEDYSYGIYIYAFPIQQTVTWLSHNQITPFENMLISFPITLILSAFSWHFIEKRALSLKRVSFIKRKNTNPSF
jgi:peptidoglycan/LPS O-acetylase OafA/YrhL